MSAAYIQVHFRLDFFNEENNMNPDQSDLGPLRLQYGLPKNISIQAEQMARVVTWGLRFN